MLLKDAVSTINFIHNAVSNGRIVESITKKLYSSNFTQSSPL
jgi:hypothetical protein